MEKYIHYGYKKFLEELFQPIKNEILFTKPRGGLWASKINASYGWKDWNRGNDFKECDENNCFKFSVLESANILTINNIENLEDLPRVKLPVSLPTWINTTKIHLDFERLFQDGIDAIEANISSDFNLYWALYGWDCDSILIMNPGIIV